MDPFESVPGYFLHLQIRRRAEKKKGREILRGIKTTAVNKFTYTFTHSGAWDGRMRGTVKPSKVESTSDSNFGRAVIRLLDISPSIINESDMDADILE